LAIADYCHDDGAGAFPSISMLAHKTRMAERSVQYGIKKLVSSGELIVDRGGQGAGRRNTYRIPFEALGWHPGGRKKGAKSAPLPAADKGAKSATLRVQDTTGKGATDCTVKGANDGMPYKDEPSYKPSLDPSSSADAPGTTSARPVAGATFDHGYRTVYR